MTIRKEGGSGLTRFDQQNFFHGEFGNPTETIKQILAPCLPDLITDGLTRPPLLNIVVGHIPFANFLYS